jgi:hypothetical protein
VTAAPVLLDRLDALHAGILGLVTLAIANHLAVRSLETEPEISTLAFVHFKLCSHTLLLDEIFRRTS